MQFSKEHLNGLYDWPQDRERSVYDNNATRRLFNRYNGNQVLFIINLIMESCGCGTLDQGKRIEGLILNQLPFSTSSELTVYNWLRREIIQS